MALPLALPLSLPSLLPSALPLQEYTVTSIVRSIVKFIAIYAGNVTLTAHSARHQRARFSRTPPIHTSWILITCIYIYLFILMYTYTYTLYMYMYMYMQMHMHMNMYMYMYMYMYIFTNVQNSKHATILCYCMLLYATVWYCTVLCHTISDRFNHFTPPPWDSFGIVPPRQL